MAKEAAGAPGGSSISPGSLGSWLQQSVAGGGAPNGYGADTTGAYNTATGNNALAPPKPPMSQGPTLGSLSWSGPPPGRPMTNPALGAQPGQPTPFGMFRSVGQPSGPAAIYGGPRRPVQLPPQQGPQNPGPVTPPTTSGAWWDQPGLASQQRPAQPRATPATPALPGFPGTAGTWQAAHTGVRFDQNGQPIKPPPTKKTSWFGGGMGYDPTDPGYKAYQKALTDPARPLTYGDQHPTDAWTPFEINA